MFFPDIPEKSRRRKKTNSIPIAKSYTLQAKAIRYKKLISTIKVACVVNIKLGFFWIDFIIS